MGFGLGPRLVIQGVIIGSVVLAVVLFMLTAGISYSSLAAVDNVTNDDMQVKQPEIQDSVAAGSPAPEQSVSKVGCSLSDRFPANILQWCDLITHYANKRGIPPNLIAALIWQESGGNPLAYSASGAVGLMQVMPRDGLAASFMCKNGQCFKDRPTIEQLKDPEFNVSYGTKLLSGLIARKGNVRDALKSYGPMNVGYYYADKVLSILQRFGGQ